MKIFQDFSTPGWAILVKSRRDAGMASISNRKPLAKTTGLRRASFGPICSPFRRLRRVGSEFMA
jgi:hypothetical protein